MKNFIFKMLPLAIIFTFMFAMTAFAADLIADKTDSSMQLEITSENYTVDEGNPSDITPRVPAPPVTDVYCNDLYISNGRVYIQMVIIGYGNRYVTYDGRTISSYSSVQYLGYSPIYGFVETYDLGPATVGSHSFYFKTTSTNSPWNTISGYVDFTIS